MDPITGAVVIAGLKYAGKPTAELVTGFLSKILGPSGDALGSALAHPIAEWHARRVGRATAIVQGAAELLSHSGLEAHCVPGRLLFPILEMGSLEEHSELQECWTSLLANSASDPDAVLPAFARILAELSPDEARVLRALNELELGWSKQISLDALHERELQSHHPPELHALMASIGLERSLYDLAMCHNLRRLSLIRVFQYSAAGDATLSKKQRYHTQLDVSAEPAKHLRLELTEFGEMFLDSCVGLNVKRPVRFKQRDELPSGWEVAGF
jgi:hypothetical protein